MSERARWSLDRARRDLAAARHLAAGGFTDVAISRAYYAAFHAAEACLLALGETRSKHAGIIAAFIRLVVAEGGFDPDIGASLRRLFDRRNEADYAGSESPPASLAATDSIADAERFVDASASWIERRT